MSRAAAAVFAVLAVSCTPESYPVAQPPQLVAFFVASPFRAPQPAANGEFQVLPITAAVVQFSAPWPAEITVALNNVEIPKDTSNGAPDCTGACVGYYKIRNIDPTPAVPVWDIYIKSPDTGAKLTIDIKSKSVNPTNTGASALSAPLTIVLGAPPVPPPPPPPSATSGVLLRYPSSAPPAKCQVEMRVEWTPGSNVSGSGINAQVKVPSNQPFTTYSLMPTEVWPRPFGQGYDTYYCDITATAPGKLSPGGLDDRSLSAELRHTLFRGDSGGGRRLGIFPGRR